MNSRSVGLLAWPVGEFLASLRHGQAGAFGGGADVQDRDEERAARMVVRTARGPVRQGA